MSEGTITVEEAWGFSREQEAKSVRQLVVELAEQPQTFPVHGAHAACQQDAPWIRSHCGIALEGSGQIGVGGGVPEPCPDCLDVSTCAVCGTPVIPLRHLLAR